MCLATGSVTGFSGSFFTNSDPTTIDAGGIDAGTTFGEISMFNKCSTFCCTPFNILLFLAFEIDSQAVVVEAGVSISGQKHSLGPQLTLLTY